MTQLSEHFSLEELEITQVRGVDNTAPPDVVSNLKLVAAKLEEVRALLGMPIIVSSGYRSPAVNVAVGGAAVSAHMLGYAADFICPTYGTPLRICEAIAASPIKFDQMIEEGWQSGARGWVHISVDPRMRREILTADFSGRNVKYLIGLRQPTDEHP